MNKATIYLYDNRKLTFDTEKNKVGIENFIKEKERVRFSVQTNDSTYEMFCFYEVKGIEVKEFI